MAFAVYDLSLHLFEFFALPLLGLQQLQSNQFKQTSTKRLTFILLKSTNYSLDEHSRKLETM